MDNPGLNPYPQPWTGVCPQSARRDGSPFKKGCYADPYKNP